MPENWETVAAFLRCTTQWQHAGMSGVRTGLIYSGVEAVLRLTVPRERHADVFVGITVMERAALAEFAKK